jgi:hypothetical protein
MQHLDEGTIHSWLDGALGGDEAARVSAHVGECPECAAAVAEARGFIAASSRILTALDNAPRGVIPAATAPRRRFDPFVLRVAATVLVVAAGTLVVFQNRGSGKSSSAVFADTDTALLLSTPGVGKGANAKTAPAITAPAPTAAATTAPSANAQIGAAEVAPGKADGKAPALVLSKQPGLADERRDVARHERREANASEMPALTAEAGRSAGAVSSGYAAAPAAPPSNVSSGVAMDMARAEEPLKVVGTPPRIGMKVTLYEVAPGDTVTLTEPTLVSLSSVVTTGANVAAQAPRTERSMAAPQSVARPDAAAAATSESQRGAVLQSVPAATPAPPPPAPVRQVEVVNGVTTISWMDPTTRNLLKLSGRMSEARLEQIKIRIERERAAAAKKTP